MPSSSRMSVDLREVALVGPDRHERAAAADALGVAMRVGLVDAGARQRADDAARRGAGTRADQRRGEPACRHDRAEARDRQHAEAGEKAGAAAEHGADGSRPCRCPSRSRRGRGHGRSSGGRRVAVALRGIVRHDADVGMRHAGRLEPADGLGRVGIAIEHRRDCSGPCQVSLERVAAEGGEIGRRERSLGGDVALVVEADRDALAVAHGLAAPDALVVLLQVGDVLQPGAFEAGLGLALGEAVGALLERARPRRLRLCRRRSRSRARCRWCSRPGSTSRSACRCRRGRGGAGGSARAHRGGCCGLRENGTRDEGGDGCRDDKSQINLQMRRCTRLRQARCLPRGHLLSWRANEPTRATFPWRRASLCCWNRVGSMRSGRAYPSRELLRRSNNARGIGRAEPLPSRSMVAASGGRRRSVSVNRGVAE